MVQFSNRRAGSSASLNGFAQAVGEVMLLGGAGEEVQDAAGRNPRGKQLVLTHKKPSQVESIADAVVIKDEDIFFLSAPDGQVPLRGRHGFGLYFHDCRFLDGYELRL